jgi:purine-binding chemotaxis protein CheW
MASETHEIVARIEELERQLYDLRRELAGRWAPDDAPTAATEVLVVRVGESRMALLLGSVEEVVMAAAVARLPEAPAWVQGLLNLRGTMVPVLDVSARLQRRQRRVELSDFVVVARVDGQPIGLLVQEVLHLSTLQAGAIERPGRDLAYGPYVTGVAHCEEEPVLVLSAAALMATSDLPEIPGDDG